jgi:hypothetical protein
MPEPSIRERLVGCWRLVGCDVTAGGGTTDRPLGDNPLGTIHGYYIAYSGPYEVDEQNGTVARHAQVSVIPSWLGTNQIRRVEFREPEVLVLSSTKQSQPEHGASTTTTTTISWSRLPPR